MSLNILVTGANRGIGLALTKEFLAAGHQVFATYRNENSAEELLQLENPNLKLLTLDIGDPNLKQHFVSLLSGLTHFDVLVNNAGVIGDKAENLAAASAEKTLETFSINSVGPFRVTQALLPWLEKSRKPIVAQITSLMGSIADNSSGGYYAYRMSKAALNMFNKCLSVDYPNMICLTLHPGWVQTEMGGNAAPLSSTDSARGLANLILKAETKQSGRFFNYKGESLPW